MFAPIIYRFAKTGKRSLLYYAVPFLAGVVISYSTIPPAAGAMTGVVGLSADGTRIVSYPAVSDVRGLPYPTPLADGYLLDNRGIGRNVAFLSYTYEEYAALPATPSPEELMEKVIDKHPLLEIHFLGNRYQYKDITRELNERIEAGELR